MYGCVSLDVKFVYGGLVVYGVEVGYFVDVYGWYFEDVGDFVYD